jgi:hypothetical protein
MSSSDLTPLQRTSLYILNDNVFDRDILRKQVPLDHGRHTLNPQQDLGDLDKLPTELHHLILEELDIEFLLTFRRVNQQAMKTVNSMPSYTKVMRQATNSVRMAVAIKNAHTFSMKQLVEKLCQKQCDGKGCGKPAPYIDVFSLQRRCLSVGGGCPFPEGPVSEEASGELSISDELDSAPIRSFRASPGKYGSHWNQFEVSSDEDTTFYDYHEFYSILYEYEDACLRGRVEAELDRAWMLCSVMAPWLSKRGSQVEYGVFCDLCEDPNLREEAVPSSLQEARDVEGDWDVEYPNPLRIPFMQLGDLAEHKRIYHAE